MTLITEMSYLLRGVWRAIPQIPVDVAAQKLNVVDADLSQANQTLQVWKRWLSGNKQPFVKFSLGKHRFSPSEPI